MSNPDRYCPCGNQGPFRSAKAVRCTTCDAEAAQSRREWAREYHAARARAVSELIRRHHVEFKEIMDHERGLTSPDQELTVYRPVSSTVR